MQSFSDQNNNKKHTEESVDEFISQRFITLQKERKDFLFEKWKETRNYIQNVKKPIKKFKLPKNIESNKETSEIQKIIINDERQFTNEKVHVFMPLATSYLKVPKNIIPIENEKDVYIKQLIKAGNKEFPGKEGHSLTIKAVKKFLKISNKYIKSAMCNYNEKQNIMSKIASSNDSCSPTCYKIWEGENILNSIITVSEEMEIMLKLTSGLRDYCNLGKEFDKSCNLIYHISKNITQIDTQSEFYQRPKKMKIMLQSTLAQDKKRRELYKGLPMLYEPCNHEGKCDEKCPCFKGKNFCEIFCGCKKDCINRFFGCACLSKCDKNNCACFVAHRVCLSGQCSCRPADCEDGFCINTNIFSQKKNLVIETSKIPNAGYGVFAMEDIKKGEFIIEYTGELITQNEAEIRGRIYDKIKLSYLFNLTHDYALDAMFIGNESRCINHSENANCASRIITVSGDKRIGIFANRNICKREELTFDYSYDEHQKKLHKLI